MKRNIFFNRKSLLTGCVFLALGGCTSLNEDVLDEVLGSDSSNAAGALAAAYDRLGDGTFTDNGGMIAMQEYSSDIAMLPTRGSDWGDGGKWREMHEFTWSPASAVPTSNWNMLTNGITRSLTAIREVSASDVSTTPQKTLFLAEAKGLLDFYTYTTLDLFGQAPYRDPMSPNAPLQILHAETAIDDLITDVETIVPDLANVGEQQTHNGRFTKQAAYALLAQMYLNRAVYKDRYNASSSFNFNEASVNGSDTDMDKVIYYSSLLIDSGTFSLASNYFSNFSINNSGAPELIWAITQKIDHIRNGDNDLAYMSMERNQRVSQANRGTNGSCITPEFYASWDGNHDDPRFYRHVQYSDGTWFMNDGTTTSVPATDYVAGTTLPWFHFNFGLQEGQQYGPKLTSTGVFEMTSDNRIAVFPLVCEKSATTPMNFTPELNFDDPTKSVFAQNQINRGVRCFKFEFDPGEGNGSSNVDTPLFRLGGVYTMRAEAYFRKGNTAAALADINTLRTTRTHEALFGNTPGTAIPTLTADILYKEIGYEMYWEMWRRPQMVRFGKLDLALPGSAKPATQPFRRIFPIPQETMDVTSGFTQNMGY
jgi:hypothetical protein